MRKIGQIEKVRQIEKKGLIGKEGRLWKLDKRAYLQNIKIVSNLYIGS